MTDDELNMYPEFEVLPELSNVDACAYLMRLANRYTKIAELAKKTANTLAQDWNDNIITSSDGTKMLLRTRETRKVDVPTLKNCYPDAYKEICEKGDITIPIKAIEDMDLDGVVTTSVSKYIQVTVP